MIGAMTSVAGLAGRVADAAASSAASADGAAAPARAASFASILGDTMAGVAGGLRAAEASAVSALNGTGTMQDAVSHMMTAERQLQQAIAVRDKLVSAYMDLTRMQI